MSFFAQPFTFLWLVESGEKTAATPDGRRNGENLAYSISPMQGRDSKGLTAVFNSIAKLPAHLAPGCTSAIIEIDPILFDDRNFPQIVTMLKTAFEKGVGQVQFNVVNAETLIKAKREPDKYRNLEVRVSGFSQRFCLLDEKLQDHIIARTKHRKM
jgi:formate C-acetyltransferase